MSSNIALARNTSYKPYFIKITENVQDLYSTTALQTLYHLHILNINVNVLCMRKMASLVLVNTVFDPLRSLALSTKPGVFHYKNFANFNNDGMNRQQGISHSSKTNSYKI